MLATDALRIEKDARGHQVGSGWGPRAPAGSLAVHVNSNPLGVLQHDVNMAVFPVGWYVQSGNPLGWRVCIFVLLLSSKAAFFRLDDGWHHVAVTWQQHSGKLQLLFDGHPVAPSLVRDRGWVKDPLGGTALPGATLAAGSVRDGTGVYNFACIRLQIAHVGLMHKKGCKSPLQGVWWWGACSSAMQGATAWRAAWWEAWQCYGCGTAHEHRHACVQTMQEGFADLWTCGDDSTTCMYRQQTHDSQAQHDIQHDLGRVHPADTGALVAQFVMGSGDVVPDASSSQHVRLTPKQTTSCTPHTTHQHCADHHRCCIAPRH